MNSPGETQLSHDLRELASGQYYTPDLASIKQLARQRHRRGLLWRGGAAAGAAVLAVGGLFFGVHGFSGDHSAGGTVAGATVSATAGRSAASSAAHPSRSGGATVRTETVAYVTRRSRRRSAT